MIVRVVGSSEDVIERVEAAGHTVSTEPPTATTGTEPSAIIAIGECALLSVARERPDAPVLPLDVGIGPTVAKREIGEGGIIEAIEHGTEQLRPLLSVSIDGELVGPAFMDVTLITGEPARISEYAIEHDESRVARFRADGVVVATPAGSNGYAAAAGGPTLATTTEALCVVPIAPFHTQSERWVLDMNPLSLSVLRDEGEVSLLIDDTEYGSIESGQQVRLAVDGYVRVLHP
jgi:NAD+ kinase